MTHMIVIVESAGVFSAVDSDHPVGSIQRVAGGAYRFVGADGSEPTDRYDVRSPEGKPIGFSTYEAAATAGQSFVAELEKNPQASADTIALRKANAVNVALEAKLADLDTALADANSELIQREQTIAGLNARVTALAATVAELAAKLSQQPVPVELAAVDEVNAGEVKG